jgi:hypothetical protein
MAGDLKVHFAYGDGGTISDSGISNSAGMNIFGVGTLVEEGTIMVGQGATGWPILFPSGNYNSTINGCWVYLKNASSGPIEIQINLTPAERSGASYEWITMGRLKPAVEGDTTASGEFIWMYLASPLEVGGDQTLSRGIKVVNSEQSESAAVQYGIFSR